LKRMVHDHDVSRGPAWVRWAHCLVHHVQELGDRDRRGAPLVEVLVPSLERDDQVFGGR
jgi:hypothetical protein